jgi:hypothetical protein
MTTFQRAATEYLTKITPTHTPATMRTYERNFLMVLTPHFGADTPLASITTELVHAFHASDALQQKPNGQPRAEPTKNQITGLLRSFLRDAESRGLNPGVEFPDAPKRAPRVLLCAKCRGPLAAAEVPTAPPVAQPSPEPTRTASKAVAATPPSEAKANRPKAMSKVQRTTKPAKRRTARK